MLGSVNGINFATSDTKVGIGTTVPLAPLDVRGNVFIGLTADAGSTGLNALFLANDGGDPDNSFRIDGDHDNLYIIARSDTGAATNTGIIFRTAAEGAGETDQARIDASGNMGLGTDSPQSRLDVRGDVKLGNSGQYFAASGEENLRIIRGTIGVNGATNAYVISHGSGFTISSSNTGVVYVTFNTAFSGIPAIVVTPDRNGSSNNFIAQLDANCGCDRTKQVKIVTVYVDQATLGALTAFDFIAIGPR